jgi:hypothetical protein
MIERGDRRDTRVSVAVLMCAVGLFFGPAVDAAGHRAFGAEPVVAARTHGLSLIVTIEGRDMPIMADAGRSESVRVRFAGEDMGTSGRAAIDAFAKRSTVREAARVLVIGGAAPGEDVANGYRRARIVRERLVAAGWNGDRLVVAGWRTGGKLPVGLGQLDRADEFVVVPLVERVRSVSSVEGDPGRALALDSAYARLAVVSDTPSPGKAPAAEAAPAAPPKAATVEAAPAAPAKPATVEAQPPETTRVRPPVAVASPTPVERTAAAASDPIARIIAGDMPKPVPVAIAAPRPAVKTAPAAVVSGGSCGMPAIVMDDFYPGGPFRDCAGRSRAAAR